MDMHTIVITYDRLIKDVQEEFNQTFPFLRIEFFRKGLMPSKYRRDCLPNKVSFGKSYRNIETGRLDITPNMTVIELEKMRRTIWHINSGLPEIG